MAAGALHQQTAVVPPDPNHQRTSAALMLFPSRQRTGQARQPLCCHEGVAALMLACYLPTRRFASATYRSNKGGPGPRWRADIRYPALGLCRRINNVSAAALFVQRHGKINWDERLEEGKCRRKTCSDEVHHLKKSIVGRGRHELLSILYTGVELVVVKRGGRCHSHW